MAKYLTFIGVTVLLFSMATLVTTVFNTAPTDRYAIELFYGSLFLVTFSLVFSALYGYHYLQIKAALPGQLTHSFFRYAFLIALTLVILVLMSANQLLSPATAITILAVGLILELLWRRQRQRVL